MFGKKEPKKKIEKTVIVCRSGKQIYSKAEIDKQRGNISGTPPNVEKDFYIEERPVCVVVDAQDMVCGIPLTKEHPKTSLIYTDAELKKYQEGFTGDKVSICTLDDNTIGIKVNVYFYTDEIYNYYLSNKEVSLGYLAEREWVDNPEEVGYDLRLKKITEINHLALTKAGRGGEKVAVIDNKEENTENKNSTGGNMAENEKIKDENILEDSKNNAENDKNNDKNCINNDKNNDKNCINNDKNSKNNCENTKNNDKNTENTDGCSTKNKENSINDSIVRVFESLEKKIAAMQDSFNKAITDAFEKYGKKEVQEKPVTTDSAPKTENAQAEGGVVDSLMEGKPIKYDWEGFSNSFWSNWSK